VNGLRQIDVEVGAVGRDDVGASFGPKLSCDRSAVSVGVEAIRPPNVDTPVEAAPTVVDPLLMVPALSATVIGAPGIASICPLSLNCTDGAGVNGIPDCCGSEGDMVKASE